MPTSATVERAGESADGIMPCHTKLYDRAGDAITLDEATGRRFEHS